MSQLTSPTPADQAVRAVHLVARQITGCSAAYDQLIEQLEQAAARLTRQAAQMRLLRTQAGERQPITVGTKSHAVHATEDSLRFLLSSARDLDIAEDRVDVTARTLAYGLGVPHTADSLIESAVHQLMGKVG